MNETLYELLKCWLGLFNEDEPVVSMVIERARWVSNELLAADKPVQQVERLMQQAMADSEIPTVLQDEFEKLIRSIAYVLLGEAATKRSDIEQARQRLNQYTPIQYMIAKALRQETPEKQSPMASQSRKAKIPCNTILPSVRKPMPSSPGMARTFPIRNSPS